MRKLTMILLGSAIILAGPAACGRSTSKTGLDGTRGSMADLKTFRDASYGFQFDYPGAWESRRGSRPSIRTIVRDGRGASCNVAVRRMPLPSYRSGKPRQLNKYLQRVTRDQVARRYPAKYNARIVRFHNARLGGQKAKRIVVRLMVNGRTPLTFEQYLTWRNFGVVTLTCGAPTPAFRTPAMQARISAVVRTFRF